MIRLRGMTWGHRRAIDPLVKTLPMFLARHPDIAIGWDARPLAGFEFTPIEVLARSHDLIILDHPFMGSVAASGALVPLDGLELADCEFIGPSLASYQMGGHLWAVPVDAATQVAVSRPDLLASARAEAPRDWQGALDLGARVAAHGLKLAIGLRGVHALMTVFSLMAGAGRPWAASPDGDIDRDAVMAAAGQIRALMAYCPPEVLDWNSIELHDAMAARDDLLFCPAVYGFYTYAEADQRRPLSFHDFAGPAGPAGSTIGGTGLALSAHCTEPGAALAYLRFAAELATQRGFAHHHGQPAHAAIWRDSAINADFGGAFGATVATLGHAWVRPRHAGYLGFQELGGDLVEAHLRGTIDGRMLCDRISDAWLESFLRKACD
jgi:multiple sugar transport system substrate-binding protein